MKMTVAKLIFIGAAVLLFCASLTAGEAIRIDASSDAAANESYQRMLESLPPERQKKLLSAIVGLNLAGVKSAYEVVNNPELQNITAAKVKAKIAGMTADEIITFAASAHKPGDPQLDIH